MLFFLWVFIVFLVFVATFVTMLWSAFLFIRLVMTKSADKKNKVRKKAYKTMIVMDVFVTIITTLLFYWWIIARSFYCLSEDKCITVWYYGGYCYIIPGKYYGIFEPKDNYVKADNGQYLTLYFSSELKKKMIVRNQGSYSGSSWYEIVNNSKEIIEIIEYSEEYREILYKPDAVLFKDVKETTEMIDLDTWENYATDKHRKNL